jgi:cytochrome c2
MKSIGFATAAGLLLAATAAAAQATDEAGRAAFTQHKCTLCHSIAGSGNKKGPLDGVGTRLSAAEIREWIVDPAAMTAKTKASRKPPMKKMPVPPADVDALVAMLSGLK